MNKRIRKKLAQWQCPRCKCKNGVIAHIVSGNVHKQKFVWCSSCKWEYELEKV